MDLNKVDLVLQYILVVAGQQDEYYDRQLGPIHLIKYVYLADLAYSELKDGEMFTQVNWQFYKFGPWSYDVFQRIEPALTQVGADKKEISHPKYEDDFIKWSLQDDLLEEKLANQLPLSVCTTIRQSVHQFGSDTPSLLNHVYLTKPMLLASPMEYLIFFPKEEPAHEEVALENVEEVKKTKKMKEQHNKKINDLKNRIHSKLEAKRKAKELIKPDPPPQYNEVFRKGLSWLDSLEGEPIEKTEVTALFSNDIWKSLARYDPDIS